MSEILENGIKLAFANKTLADAYCKKLWDTAYKIDVVTVNDVLVMAKRPVSPQGHVEGLQRGYTKKELRKLKPVKTEDGYLVILPPPSRMIRDAHGYWTTEKEK